ncbi:AAA family ATPase [Streptomyces sp. NPDC051287]|uniref:AAA family ATPase n=1 Tax=Streptomyces sp. NPDC051287 TaxID=3365648 RepID=UPI0037AA463C
MRGAFRAERERDAAVRAVSALRPVRAPGAAQRGQREGRQELMRRPAAARLGLGDRVRFADHAWSVVGLDGEGAELVNALGQGRVCPVHHLVGESGFEVLEQGPRSRPAAMPPSGVPPAVHAQALWWERHLVEVIGGRPPDADPALPPRPAYDPGSRTLAEREAAKAEELTAAGFAGVSARTVRRKRQQYQSLGVSGLYDRRATRSPTPGLQIDPRVRDCLITVLSAEEGGRARPMEYYRQQTLRAVIDVHGGDESWLPSRSTFYRLLGRLSAAHVGQGRRRRPGQDGKPVVIAGGTWLSRPGERVYVDAVVLQTPDGKNRMQLTAAIDELTWSVCALTVDGGDRPADAGAFLARWWTAVALRPASAGQGSGSARPSAELRPTAPLIMPERIALAPGAFPTHSRFAALCRQYGVSLLPTSPMLVTSGERKMSQLTAQFTSYLAARPDAGVAGRWSAQTVQMWAQEWVERDWQHREIEPLRPVAEPDFAPTPSGAFAACVARQGWVHLPLPPAAYPELLPEVRQRLSPAGLMVQDRRYGGPVLDGLRGAVRSVRADAYDPDRVWVYGPDSQWIDVPELDAGSGVSSLETDPHVDMSAPAPPAAQVRPRWGLSAPGAQSQPIRQEVLMRSAEVLQRQARIAHHATLTVPGDPLSREVCVAGERLLELNRFATTDRRMLVVTGPSGCGKTHAVRELAEHFADISRIRGADRSGPVTVHVSVPPSATAREVLVRLAHRLDVAPPARTAALSDAVEHALVTARTALVVIDDAHGLRPASSSAQPSAWEVLRFLGDQVPCVFAYTANSPDLNALWGTNEHGRLRRTTHVAGGPITDMTAWRHLVQRTEDLLHLNEHRPGSLSAASTYLHERSSGLVGGLAHLVRSAAVQAILDGSESVTRESFDHVS